MKIAIGQADNETIIGSNRIIQRIVVVDSFRSIQVDNYNVYLVQDTLYEVRISGEDNIIEAIQIINENGVLTVQAKSNTKLKNNEPIEIAIHFIDINEINTENAEYETIGSISTRNLQVTSTSSELSLELYVDSLRVDLSGDGFNRGILKASGDIGNCDVSLRGKAVFDSPSLTGNNFQISYSERSYYRIKKENFKETNVKSSSNQMQRMSNAFVDFLSFFWW